MKPIYTFLLCCSLTGALQAQLYPAQNFTLLSNINPETGFNSDGLKYSGCWGWVQPSTNKEYAIAASQSGTYWVDVTNPASPTVCAYRVGAHNGATWREVKTYQNYCYVISDDPGTNRLQIFDMQYLPDSVHKIYDSQSLFRRGHAHWIDGNKWYVASVTYSNSTFSEMNVYSLATPSVPVLLRSLDQDYPSLVSHVHDMFVRHDTIFASCGFDGLYVFKLTASNTFSLISSLTSYPFSGYNHSSALTPNGQTLVFLDEVPASLPVKVADVSNLSNIQVLQTINQYSNTTPHNPFIVNNQYCFVSSYQDGLQLFDISNPSAPFLAGYFDSYPQSGGNNNTWPQGSTYSGQWGCYPYFPSKNIFCLDRLNGLFMLSTHLYQNSPLSVVASFNSPSVACVGTSVQFTNTSTGATSYSWTFPGGNPSTSTLSNPSVTYSLTFNHTITLSAWNGTAQSVAISTIQVKKIILNTFTLSASCATCANGVASVLATAGTPPYTYSWIPSGGSSSVATSLLPQCYTVHVSDQANCEASKVACINHTETATGISETNGEKALLLFPNPACTTVLLQVPDAPYLLKIYNSLGELVYAEPCIHEETEVDVSAWPEGIYLAEAEYKTMRLRKKLLVKSY